MNNDSIKILRSLNLYCYICGLATIFLGMVVMYMSALTLKPLYTEVGLLIFMTGYAFVNIARKVGRILDDEQGVFS
jgi:hypothetical protein